MAGLAVRPLNSLLRGIPVWTGTTSKTLPKSYSSMKTMRKKLQLQLPKKYKLDSGSEFHYYSMEDHLVRIFGNRNHCHHLSFSPSRTDGSMAELVDTPMFKKLARATSENQLPVGIILYYDKFGVFRSKTGSIGGLYFTLANFDCKWRGDDDNLFCLGLVPRDGLFEEIISLVVKELHQMDNGLVVYHKGLGRCVTIKPSLGMFLADMPQRNQACCQKSQKTNRPCHMCTVLYNNLSAPFDSSTMKLRTHAFSKLMYHG